MLSMTMGMALLFSSHSSTVGIAVAHGNGTSCRARDNPAFLSIEFLPDSVCYFMQVIF